MLNGSSTDIAQLPAEVRIFRVGALDKGEDVAGKETSVDLPGEEDLFAFHIEVSVQPPPTEVGGEVASAELHLDPEKGFAG